MVMVVVGLTVAGAISNVATPLPSPFVRVHEGLLHGICTHAVCFFGAIPFAAPPTGVLRFRDPQPPLEWEGKRNATGFGAKCLQMNSFVWTPESYAVGDEDCLFLNIWSPAGCMISNRTCATLLWIHGGAYDFGSGSDFNGTNDASLAKDVIIVTINYRLNVLGWAAVPPGNMGASTGNFGLQDQRAAMRWVRANIGSFGGDSKRVTIAGESAGAFAISCHLCSHLSRTAFSGAIMESGGFSSYSAQSRQQAETQYQRLLRAAGCEGVACLRTLGAKRLTGVGMNRTLGFGNASGKSCPSDWAPVVDGVELGGTPHELLVRGKCQSEKPILIGVNRDEGTLFNGFFSVTRQGDKMTKKDLRTFFKHWLVDDHRVAQATDLYAVGASPHQYSLPYWAATHFIGDAFYSCPALTAAGHWPSESSDAGKAFAYFFDYEPISPMLPKGLPIFPDASLSGVCHTYEMPFVWQQALPVEGKLEGQLVGSAERVLARTVAAYWINFAKSGDPNIGIHTALSMEWPEASMPGTRLPPSSIDFNPNITVLQFNLPELSAAHGRLKHQCAFHNSIYPIPFPKPF